jgi:cob(I)alamin adenosyltransferase
MRIPDLKEKDVELLEKEMDKLNESIPEMKVYTARRSHHSFSFTLPAVFAAGQNVVASGWN